MFSTLRTDKVMIQSKCFLKLLKKKSINLFTIDKFLFHFSTCFTEKLRLSKYTSKNSFHDLRRKFKARMISYNPFSKMKESKCGNFATKLHSLLNNPRYSSIISWGDNSAAIQILDSRKMEQEVLPVYFRQSRFESFVRQLNLYGFKKVKSQQSIKFIHPNISERRQLTSISTIKKNKSQATEEENQQKENLDKDQSVKMTERGSENVLEDRLENCVSLGQNNSHTFQPKNNTILPRATSNDSMSYLQPVLYYCVNPYLYWNFGGTQNNLSVLTVAQATSTEQKEQAI